MRGAAPEEDENDRHLIIDPVCRQSLLRGEEAGQGQAEKTCRTDLQEFAAGDPIAGSYRFMSEFDHGFLYT